MIYPPPSVLIIVFRPFYRKSAKTA